jgi:hypothetical protein
MKIQLIKFFKVIYIPLILLSLYWHPIPVFAQQQPSTVCNAKGYSISYSYSIDKSDGEDFIIELSGLAPGMNYHVNAKSPFSLWGNNYSIPAGSGVTDRYSLRIPDNSLPAGGPITFVLYDSEILDTDKSDCVIARNVPAGGTPTEASCSISITNASNADKRNCGDNSSDFNVLVANAVDSDGNPLNGTFDVVGAGNWSLGKIQVNNGNSSTALVIPGADLKIGTSHTLSLKGRTSTAGPIVTLCQSRSELIVIPNADQCEEYLTSSRAPGIFKLCQAAAVENGGENPCTACYESEGIWTALGCLPTRPADLLPKLAQFAVGLAGGIALMLMLVGAFRISVSAGNPDNVQAGKDMFTSAIAGLLLIIFSALILRIAGVDIFQLPGF